MTEIWRKTPNNQSIYLFTTVTFLTCLQVAERFAKKQRERFEI